MTRTIRTAPVRTSGENIFFAVVIMDAFLAPQIIKAAVDGHLPRGVNAKALVDAPVEWTQQWQALGLQQG